MITIGRPFIYDDGEFAYVKANISISKDTVEEYINISDCIKHVHWRLYENYPPVEWNDSDSGLWFAVPCPYKDYLCAEHGDAFVVAMLWYAMVTGSDIESIAPVSLNLAFSVQNLVIPALMKEIRGYKRQIKLICPTTKECFGSKGVGTGMSCGVDSLYTLKLYSNAAVPDEYRLTHLAYFNMGAIFHPDRSTKTVYSMKEFYEATDRMSEEKLQNAEGVGKLADLPVLYIKSNIDSDYYRGAYGDTAVYRNCACALAIQKLFGKYYCSSAGWPEYFNLHLDQGSEHYEALLITAFSTESLQFILSDYDSRLEKTIALADDKIAQEYLDVCFRFNNCGECAKCYRTLVTLDVLGKVDGFRKIFDVDKFLEKRDFAYAWLLKAKDGDKMDDNAVFATEIYNYALDHGFKIPDRAYLIYKKRKRSSTPWGRLKTKIKKSIINEKNY